MRNPLIILSLLLCIGGHAVAAATLQGVVTGIETGVQIKLRTSDGRHRQIRLLGVRVPTHSSAWIANAKRHLSMLLAGRTVSVEYQNITNMGVILGIVRHGGADTALRMLKAGLVRVVHDPQLTPETLRVYLASETLARSRRMGLWQH